MLEQGIALASDPNLVNASIEGKIIHFSTSNTQATRYLPMLILHLDLKVNKLRPFLELLQKLFLLQYFFLVPHSLVLLLLFDNQPVIVDPNSVQFILSLDVNKP